jgi:hypothetical protein
MHRRSLLRAGAALALGAATAALAGEAEARDRAPRVRRIEPGARGVTIELAPRSAPYPLAGRPWTDPTVLAFVPRHLRLAGRALDVVVFFHGHGTTAREALVRHQLREQLAESRQNAVLVVPQGPVRAADGDFGKLMRTGGLARLLGEVRELLAGARVSSVLGPTSCAGARRVDRVVVAAHSGGYRAGAAAVAHGGIEVREAWLFDALYGEAAAYRDWLLAAPSRRKLVTFAIGGEPLRESVALAAALRARGVEVQEETPLARLSRAEMVHARAILARPAATHGTATFAESALRDCLVASCLRGRGSDAFFEDADAPRDIDRRT